LQVGGLIRLTSGAVLSFGLAHYGSSEFELMAEELLMSDSVIKVSKQSYNAYFSWNNSTSLLLYKLTIFFIYFLFFFFHFCQKPFPISRDNLKFFISPNQERH
jgi:hypothetical protein